MPGDAPARSPRPASRRRSAAATDGGTAAEAYAARPWLASYPDGVPADYDFPAVPLTRLLDDAASSWPSRTAVAFFGTRITYRELKDAVDRFATALAGLGVGKGDRVAVVLPNCPQNVITTYAALRLGAVVVQHNPLYTEAELRHQLADCGARVVVCLDRVYETVARVRRDTAVEQVVVTSLVDYLSTAEKIGLRLPLKKSRRARSEVTAPVPKGAPVRQFLTLLRGAATPARQVAVDPATDLALLQYTGGTTGLSKGAMLTHGNLVSNAYMNRLWDTGASPGKEVCLAVLPLFHAYGLTVCMNATLLLGGTLVLLPRFDLDRVFAAIETWKPTMLPGVPPIYKALSDSPKARTSDLSSIRVCVSGAMKLPSEVQEQFERISGARLVEGYGMTETSPSTHCNPITGMRKVGSIGVPLPGTECTVVDPDDSSRVVPPGEAGELAVRGPQVFAGYWGQAADAAAAGSPVTPDGFLLTGDIAVMDDDGFFTVVDRKKELIIAGGFNIYPSEVEEVLFRLPGVRDAVVIGVPDRYRGETVKAFVVRAPGADLDADDVTAHCATELTAYKVPKIVEFRDELPRTPVGKVLRRVLVEQERAAAADEPVPASVPGGVRRQAPAAPAEPPAADAASQQAPPPAAEQVPVEPAPVEKARARKAPAKNPAADEAAAASAGAKKAPAEQAAAEKAPAKKAPAKKAAAEKGAAKKAPAKKAAVKRAPAKRAPAKRAPARRAPAPAASEPPAPVEPSAQPPVEPPTSPTPPAVVAPPVAGPGRRVVTARPDPRNPGPADGRSSSS